MVEMLVPTFCDQSSFDFGIGILGNRLVSIAPECETQLLYVKDSVTSRVFSCSSTGGCGRHDYYLPLTNYVGTRTMITSSVVFIETNESLIEEYLCYWMYLKSNELTVSVTW